MLLSEYLSELVKVIDEYARAGLLADSKLRTDFRTEKIGIIEGEVTFSNNSKLIFTEYLDLKYKPQKLNYSFHYQQGDGSLVFRYDNAKHKPSIAASGHKHLPDGNVEAAEVPLLKEIFTEIAGFLL
ncbi:MAG: hypothetical protein HY807_10975 [Nitrospirae bacterium]|nr:hypothetical protein [Nitrospirota bacterium]